MRDKLVLKTDRAGWRVQWWLAEESDLGACLGDEWPITVTAEAGSADWEHQTATVAAASTTGRQRDGGGFYWGSRRLAQSALLAANAALKRRPLADWEKKALENGWLPPKGRL
ncbi:hypothetical protein [Sorangium sp. So ce1024]|uniref:hypothetical protein n=1 Tax=Sorangium sp. So ce1024 TaxID=3133327 RepID=UPI003EFE2C2C